MLSPVMTFYQRPPCFSTGNGIPGGLHASGQTGNLSGGTHGPGLAKKVYLAFVSCISSSLSTYLYSQQYNTSLTFGDTQHILLDHVREAQAAQAAAFVATYQIHHVADQVGGKSDSDNPVSG